MPGLSEQSLSECEAFIVEIIGIAGGGRVPHVSKFISIGCRNVRYLVQQPRWDRTVKNEISIKQWHLFDGFPPPDRGWIGLRRHVLFIEVLFLRLRLSMRIWTVCTVWLQYWSVVIIIVAIVGGRVRIERIVALRMRRI